MMKNYEEEKEKHDRGNKYITMGMPELGCGIKRVRGQR